MAAVTISDVMLDSSGTYPTAPGGSLTFTLSGFFIDSAGKIRIPDVETCVVSSADGTFSITLESTTDGTPATRTYAVALTTTIDSQSVTVNLGTIQVPPSPTTVQLSDLIIADLVAATTLGTQVWSETLSPATDGTTTVFTVAQTPATGYFKLELDGVGLEEGIHYTRSGRTITMLIPPLLGQRLRAFYLTA